MNDIRKYFKFSFILIYRLYTTDNLLFKTLNSRLRTTDYRLHSTFPHPAYFTASGDPMDPTVPPPCPPYAVKLEKLEFDPLFPSPLATEAPPLPNNNAITCSTRNSG